MAGNNSIQILRGNANYNPKTSDVILADGQPFYSKKTTELFVGNGTDAIKELQPIKALTLQEYDATSDVAQSGTAVAQAITPMTNEQIDDLWEEVEGLGSISQFAMTSGYVPVWNGTTFTDGAPLETINSTVDQVYDADSENAQSGLAVAEAIKAEKLDEKLMTFRYFTVPAGKFYPIKRNGTYMIYNGKDANDKEQKITLVRRSDDVWTEVFTGAKQVSLTTATVAIEGRYTYQLCGMYWSGSNSVLGVPTTEGFRQATTNYAYITSAGKMYVCECVQGKPLSIQDTQAKCIGPQGEAYKE